MADGGAVIMADLKLGKLPDRTPVKLTISVLPDLHKDLSDYAAIYREAYGDDEPITELIPQMLILFLANDRGFARSRSALSKVDRGNG
jgi:hypothetical protein